MAKSIKKSKDNDYRFLISANLNKKKLIRNVEKTVLSSLNNKNSCIPLSNLTITVNGIKKTTLNYWKLATIFLLLVTILSLVFFFKFFTSKNLSPVSQQPSFQIITPTPTPSPKVINRKINILILNGSKYPKVASKLKGILIENMFDNVIIGNNKQVIDSVLIQYKLGFEFEAKYLKENYLGLSGAILSQIKDINSPSDIIIILGKSYISK